MTKPHLCELTGLRQIGARVLRSGLVVFILCLSATCGFGQTASPGSDPAMNAILRFFKSAGWSGALNIKTAVASGTIDTGDGTGPHAITLKIERGGRFGSEIPDLNVHMVTSIAGGAARKGDKQQIITVSESTQLSSSALLPIFTPLSEVGKVNVITALSSTDSSTTVVLVAKAWQVGDDFDSERQKSGLVQLSFDNQTGVLRSLSYNLAWATSSPNQQSSRFEYGNYQPVSGIAMPFTVREYINGNLFSTLNLSSIVFNTTLGDSDFAMPEVQQ